MGTLSDFSKNTLLDLAFGAVAYSRPGTAYGSLHTATLTSAGSGTEVSGNAYARRAITNNSTNFPAASGLSKALAVAQNFTPPSGSWGTITDGGLWDSSTAGNLLICDVLTAPKTPASGDAVSFEIGDIAISLSGAISTYLGNALLDHMFGGGAYTPPATWYLALFVSGVEVSGNNYSRTAITNNTTQFPVAVGGSKSVVVPTMPIPSGAWGTVDEWRFLDAASAGNTGWAKALTTPRVITGATTPVRFSSGALVLQLS